MQQELIYNTKWDYLVILDACRYDLFREHIKNYLTGNLTKAITLANRTIDWFNLTFTRPLPVIYYSANANIRNQGSVFKVKEVWRDKDWLNPSLLTDIIISECPKKAIIHYVQPHISNLNFPDIQFKLYIKTVILRKLTPEKIKSEYIKNLNLVLKECVRLFSKFSSKQIIMTSDHGDMLGEDQLYFHEYSTDLYHPILREIPWFEVKGIVESR